MAARFLPEVAPFAGLARDDAQSFEALGRLLVPGDAVFVLSVSTLTMPAGLQAEALFHVLQMVDRGTPTRAAPGNVVRLGAADAPEMLALAQRAQPGPFGTRTHAMGNYVGMRDGGALAAMAGERMQWPGHVEISAVCVDERLRGRGLAPGLMDVLRREILARASVPFLHVRDDNDTAIALYERMGFATRQRFALYRVALS